MAQNPLSVSPFDDIKMEDLPPLAMPKSEPAETAKPSRSGVSRTELRDFTVKRASELGVDPNLALAILGQESGGNPNVRNSPKGAVGPGQVMPATYKAMMGTSDGQGDPFNSVEAGLRYLRYGATRLGTTDPKILAAGYHSGMDRKELRNGTIPDTDDGLIKTADYANNVVSRIRKLGGKVDEPASDFTITSRATKDDDFSIITDPNEIAGYQDIDPDKLANNLSFAQPRHVYEYGLRHVNPDADESFFQKTMREYDEAQKARTEANANRVQSNFDTLNTEGGVFQKKLDQRLAGPQNGIVPTLPTSTDMKVADEQATEANQPRPGIIEQAGNDLSRGISNAKGLGYGIAALGADAAGYDEMADSLLKSYIENEKSIAKENPAVIGSYKNIGSMGDAGRYAVEAVFENLPMMLPSLVTGGVGAIAARKGAEKLVEGMVASQVEKGIAQKIAEENAAKFVAKRIAAGAAAGAAPASIAMEQGSIFGDIYKDTGEKKAGIALAYGIPAGILDSIEPIVALRKVAGPIVNDIGRSIIKRYGVEAGKQLLIEGGTEGLQTVVENLAKMKATGKYEITPALIDDVIDSTLKGGIGGAGIGVASQGVEDVRHAIAQPAEKPAGPLDRAVDEAASPTVKATAPDGQEVKGKPVAETSDGKVAIVGDDGTVHTFQTGPGGVTITAESGPLTNALDGAVESVATPEPMSAIAPSKEDAEAPVAAAEQDQPTDLNDQSAQKAAPAPEQEPANSAETPAENVDPETGEVLAPERAPEPPALSEMDEPALRERLKYIATQAKTNGGWNKMLSEQRRLVEREIGKRQKAAKAEKPEPTATNVPMIGTNAKQKETPEPTTSDLPVQSQISTPAAPINETPDADGYLRRFIKKEGAANDIAKSLGGVVVPNSDGSFDIKAVSHETKTAPPGAEEAPAVSPIQQKGLDRIAKGTAYFHERKKADEWLAKHDLGATHEVVPHKKRFDIKAKVAEGFERFGNETGTLGIPREEMPQIQTESHGGLVRHLNANGIEHETKTVSAEDLKPTQAEFSPERVEQAKEAEGDRAVIVSKDGHIIDGHHQVLAAQENGEEVKAIVLNAPINEALEAVKNSPSAQPSEATNGNDNNPAGQPNGAEEVRQAETKPAATAVQSDGEPEAKEEVAKPDPFAKNKLFTSDKVAAARARMKSKLGQINSGLDPELVVDGMTIAGAHVESGTRSFAAYSKAMIEDFGDAIKPYLLSFYEAVRHYPSLDNDGMSSPASAQAQHEALMLAETEVQKSAATSIVGSKENDNEPAKLDQSGPAKLEGEQPQPVPGSEQPQPAGAGAEGSGRTDAPGDERTGAAGLQQPGSVGNDAREVPVPAGRGEQGRGGERGRATVQRSQRAAKPDPQRELGGQPELFPSDGQRAQDRAADFVISDDDAIGEGGQKTKYRNNVAAIKLLKELQEASRPATRDEQAVLAKYVGWGGIPQAFERDGGEVSKGWENEASELKGLLTKEELAAAAASTRNAHYTAPEIVTALWDAVRRFGFTGGRTLEPSVGVGNFFGLMPGDLRSASQLTGVELDRITGGIAKQLYPQANIQSPVGFQDFNTPDGYFDLAIGNPPFGREGIYDPRRKPISGFSIHNYFFAKSIDAVRPGGVLGMVVTNRLLDSAADKARAYIAERADFIGAIRLPNNAFLKNAGTEVTTDIIFLRKRGEGIPASGEAWSAVKDFKDKDGNTVPLNEYFVAHPEMMLGDFGAYGSMYSQTDPALVAKKGQDTPALLKAAIAKLPKGFMTPSTKLATSEAIEPTMDIGGVKVGSVFVQDGNLFERREDMLGKQQAVPVTLPSEKALERVTGMVNIRDALVAVRRLQLREGTTDKALQTARADLNRTYDAFVKANGPLNGDANKRLMRDDPAWPQLSALEDNFDKGVSRAVAKTTGETPREPSAQKAAIFFKRTQSPYQPPGLAHTAQDALVSALSERGRVDLDYMQTIYPARSAEEITRELGDLVFKNPSGGWETRDQYLSGNVKQKLAQAIDAAKADRAMQRNVDALREVQPADIEAVDIDVKVGAHWLPADVMEGFNKGISEARGVKAIYNRVNAQWTLQIENPSAAASTQYATDRVALKNILEAAANQKTLQVYDQHADGSRTLNEGATAAANEKIEKVKEEWRRWIWDDDARRERLARIYNDVFNTDVSRAYDGSHLTFPGKVSDEIITLRPHQKNAVWRIVQGDPTLLDHVVGAGKTYTAIAAAMEMRRMGLAKKPMLAVPNHLVGQWAADFMRLYPGANILATTKKDFEKDNRKRLFARIASGDWDAVIVAHSSLGKVEVEPAFQAKFIESQVQDMDRSIEEMRRAEGKSSRNVKQIEKQKTLLQEKLKKLLDSGTKDDNLYWGELGVDGLTIDELHEFKNLGFSTSMSRVAGLGNPTGSQKAADLYMKAQSMLERTGGRNFIGATGTPISNTMAEMYTMQRYFDSHTLQAQGISHFDAWAKTFGEVVSDWELSPSGQYKLNSRFAKFVNMPELMQRYTSFADVVNRDDINRMLAAQGKVLPVPKVKGGKPQNVVVERSTAQADYIGVPTIDANGNEQYAKGTLIWRAENMPKKAEKGADNMLKIMSDARKAALDMRLINPSYGDNPASKVNEAADRIKSIYNQWQQDKGTQLVFIDLSTPKGAVAKEAAALRALMKAAEEGDEAAQEKLDAMSPDELMALESADFSVYDDLKAKLIARGIPENEIAFIHDANTELQKEDLFGKVRSGRIRVLFGSTAKMGAGMNVQERLVALHHLDAPWRPSDLEQREGRIIRQGNKLYDADPENFEIDILRYATKQTLDSRMWQTIEAKARFIEQVRKGTGERAVEDVAGEAANSAEMKAASSGNPLILEEMSLRQAIRKLENQRAQHLRDQHRIRDNIRFAKERAAWNRKQAAQFDIDAPLAPAEFAVEIGGQAFDKHKEAGEAMLAAINTMLSAGADSRRLGMYGGFEVTADDTSKSLLDRTAVLTLQGKAGTYQVEANPGSSAQGLAQRMANSVRNLAAEADNARAYAKQQEEQVPKLEAQSGPWGKEPELAEAKARHMEVIGELKPKKDQPNAVISSNNKPIEGEQDDSVPNESGGSGSREPVEAGGVSGPRKETYRPRANGISARLARGGIADIIGASGESAADVADAAQVFRNPKYETFRILFTRDGKVVGGTGISSRLPGNTSVVPAGTELATFFGSTVKQMMQAHEADGYWLVHNHPDGDPTPSEPDRRATLSIKRALPGMRGHVIVNSNRYAFIRPDGSQEVVVKHYGKDELLVASQPHDLLGYALNKTGSVAGLVKSLQLQDGYMTLVGVDSQAKVRAIFDLNTDTFNHQVRSKAAIRMFARRTGSDKVIAILPGDMKPTKANVSLITNGFLHDVVSTSGKRLSTMTGARGLPGVSYGSYIDQTGRFVEQLKMLDNLEELDRRIQNLGNETGEERRAEERRKVERHFQQTGEMPDVETTLAANRATKQTDTPAFRKWFAGSKVVDAEGDPLVVYHGTADQFSEFKTSKRGSNTGAKDANMGFWFSSDAEHAGNFNAARTGNHTLETFLALQNPLVVDHADIPLDVAHPRGDNYESTLRTDAIVKAKREGRDGVIFKNTFDSYAARADMSGAYRVDLYVAFRPEQIKSATQNNGNFDPTNPSIIASGKTPIEESGLTPPEQKLLRRIQATVQYNNNRVKQVQDRIEKVTGQPIPEYADYVGAGTNRPGRTAARLEDARDKLFEPLMTKIAKSGYTPDQVEDLTHAMHAKERNDKLGVIHPEDSDFYRAMTDHDVVGASGMSTNKAKSILAKYKNDKALHDLADDVRAIAQATQDLKVAYGLPIMSANYKYYVPLKGDGEYGPKPKRAIGHEERDEHILENIARDHEQAVVAGERNLAKQPLLQMVLTNPDPELWTVGIPPKGRYIKEVKSYRVLFHGSKVAEFPTIGQVRAYIMGDSNRSTQYTVETDSGEQVQEFAKPLQDNEIMVYVDGQPVRIQFKDEQLANQLRPLNQGQMDFAINALRKVIRYLATVYTGKNPYFIPRNMVRDAITGTINLLGNHGATVTAQAWIKYAPAFAAMLQWAATKKVPNTKMGQFLKEYRDHGGKTGASWMSDLEQQGKTLEAMFDDAAGLWKTAETGTARRAAAVAWRKTIGRAGHVIEVANQAAENALRLALYATLREQGWSPSRAAQAAKSVTVDFDRRGTATPALGALYIFVNPAIQSTANAANTLVNGQHKGQAWTALGMLVSLGVYMALSGMDDDKDTWLGRKWSDRTKNVYWKISKYLKLPMSQEYAPFYAFGVATAEVSRGESKMAAAGHILSSFLDAYVPLNGMYDYDSDNHGADLVMSIIPTIPRTPAEIALNRNSFGTPIVPDYNPNRPDNLKMNRGTKGSVFDSAAQGIARAGEMMGANRYENDITKVSPETLKYLWRTYTGGLGQVAADTLSIGSMISKDAGALETKDMPFVKDFVKQDDTQALRSRFHQKSDEIHRLKDEYKEAEKAGDDEEMQKMEPVSKITMRHLTGYSKRAAEVRDEMVDVLQDKSLSLSEQRAKLKELDKREQEIYRDALDAFR